MISFIILTVTIIVILTILCVHLYRESNQSMEMFMRLWYENLVLSKKLSLCEDTLKKHFPGFYLDTFYDEIIDKDEDVIEYIPK